MTIGMSRRQLRELSTPSPQVLNNINVEKTNNGLCKWALINESIGSIMGYRHAWISCIIIIVIKWLLIGSYYSDVKITVSELQYMYLYYTHTFVRNAFLK